MWNRRGGEGGCLASRVEPACVNAWQSLEVVRLRAERKLNEVTVLSAAG